jgi:hypothetical protein
MWRKFRKGIGLPASSDAGKIAVMIKELVQMAVPHRSHNAPISAVISYPGLVALCEEEITDAAEFARVTPLKGLVSHQPREIFAAYAGHSMGLCESYADKEKCRAEGLKLPLHQVLLMEYTEQALLLHISPIREAYDVLIRYNDVAASFDLGSGDERAGHTARVKAFVLKYLQTQFLYQKPKEVMVIMTGSPEPVGDIAVQKAIKDAIKEFGAAAEMITKIPDYVASQGAAEIAWRALSLHQSGQTKVV